ncbi:glycosyltransferase family 4 protein [Corynebacterium kozikiae]|uniref:glycosyltransferase family 4 protein n=1 Tax=Corynebacterium kozikiae TaxID=2968469 RepID=UPI00211CF39F|nr:glycosyltransferase family 4 protein [Corynebacterium sp. 76QC2CO]MCQ9342958.1 glycosyltransferase family 4 protein [Corynebacterium sp. 76QC2CO]
MKIHMLCWRDTGHPQGGGSERYLEQVAQYAASHGHEVTFQTAAYAGAPAESTHNGVRFLRAGGKYTVYLRALAALPKDADVIVDTQNGIPFFAKLFTRTPVVLLTHHCHREQWPVAGWPLRVLGWWLESKVAPRVYRNSQYVTVSGASREELVDLGVRADQIAVVRNGISAIPERVVPAQTDLEKQRVIVVSRLVPHKQLEHVIDLARATEGVHVDIVGSGWWEQRLRSYARGLEHRVFFHGYVSEQRKHELLSRAAVHVLPSRKEGWGLAVIEAAQHGVPTVGYRTSGGLRDSVGNTGILVDTPEQLIAATRELLTDAPRRRRLGELARERAAGYSWERTGQEFLEILSAVANGNSSQKTVSETPSQ